MFLQNHHCTDGSTVNKSQVTVQLAEETSNRINMLEMCEG